MAINKKLIHFKSKQKFNEELANGNILDTSIIFILETTEIYTHGLIYDGSTFDPSNIEESIQNLLINKVDKVSGKGLSTNDFTAELKTKLDGLSNYDDSSLTGWVSSLDSQLNFFPADRIKRGYLNTHPENEPVIIPFVNNDIAHLLKRGGTAVVKYDDVQEWVDITNVFDGSPSYWNASVSDVNSIVIELTLHKTFCWTSIIYVDFGHVSWKAGTITIDVMNQDFANDTWTQKGFIENNEIGQYWVKFEHIPVGSSTAGDGFNKVRFTFSDFSQYGSFRIAALGLINYDSSGLREAFIPRDGGVAYGGIYPNASDTHNLGSSSNKWNDTYTSHINGVWLGNDPKFTDTTYSSATSDNDGLMSSTDKSKLDNAVISDGTVLKVVYVTALPDEPDSTTLYIIPE